MGWWRYLFSWPFLVQHYGLSRTLLVLILLVWHPLQGRVAQLSFLVLALLFVGMDHLFTPVLALWLQPTLLLLLRIAPQLGYYLPAAPLIEQPRACKHNARSFALPTRQGPLPINNPQRGIYILGNQGSGKTHFLVEPLLYHYIQQGYTGLIYDYDYEAQPYDAKKQYCLTKFAYNCFLKFRPYGMAFQTINFAHPTHSYRINPMAQRYIRDRALLEEYLGVLLRNLNPASEKAKDFWINSSKVLLKAILVFLSNRHARQCTLPHAVAMGLQPIGKLLAALQTDVEARQTASSIFDAYEQGEKAGGQLAGVLATFKVSLQLLLSPNIFWVLGADEITLSVNKKEHPALLCLGNYPPARAAYSPVLALLLTVCFKALYGHHRVKSFVMLDELPTLFLPSFAELPATARKYGVSTVACVQSNAQLEHTYGAVGARQIQETLVNKFIGNCEGSSAAFGSALMGKAWEKVAAASSSTSLQEGRLSETQGESLQEREKEVLKAQAFMRFRVGEFAGKVPESDGTFFQRDMLPVRAYDPRFVCEKLQDLPPVCKAAAIQKHFYKVQQEAADILEGSQQQ